METVIIYAIVFGSSALGLIALLLFLHPSLRPKRLTRTIGWACAAMSLPIGISYLTNTGFPMWILTPAASFVAVLVSIGYLVLGKRHGFPLATIAPVVVLLLSALWGIFAIIIMSDPGFGGGNC